MITATFNHTLLPVLARLGRNAIMLVSMSAVIVLPFVL